MTRKELEPDRHMTPEQVLSEMSMNVEEIKNIVVVVETRSGEIATANSYDNGLTALGMIDLVKEVIRKRMK